MPLMRIFIISFLMVVNIPLTFAGEALDKLKTFTVALQALEADFTQTLFDENMQQLEVSGGKLHLQKPGKFRWDYQRPYEQSIVSDGEQLWLYDTELEQVTVKPLGEALGATPISLLTSDVNLEEEFKVIELGKMDGRFLVQLEAKVKDTDFGYILLAFNDKNLQVMELKDKLGQVTRIELDNQTINPALKNEVFKFTPPEGVDVIGQ